MAQNVDFFPGFKMAQQNCSIPAGIKTENFLLGTLINVSPIFEPYTNGNLCVILCFISLAQYYVRFIYFGLGINSSTSLIFLSVQHSIIWIYH